MERIACEKCETYFEIETIHMIIDVPEHVEFNMCKECFEKELKEDKK